MNDTQHRLRQERDLYRGLLHLGATEDPRPFLEEALRCIVAATGSRQGYLALYRDGVQSATGGPGTVGGGSVSGGPGTRGAEGSSSGASPADQDPDPSFWIAHDCSAEEIQQMRSTLSTGIIRAALERGTTISTASALEDPRFRDQRSVAARGIRAVLCAPIGEARVGVLYLQGRLEPGPYSEEDRLLLEDFARQVAPYAERLLSREPQEDPTLPFRRQLSGLEGLAGRSRPLADLFRQVALVAPLDVNVLLLGPSGAGKTALARAIHGNGPRRTGPFVELNSAALPEHLLESELFGAEKGAHSTADRKIEGKVDAAEGGTLFLDEVGDIPLAAQARLLQFLQSRQFFRLGGNRPITADVRLIAATNADLKAAMEAGRFREDLYYRLAVLPIRVPSLAERREDVGCIADALAEDIVRRHRLPPLTLSTAARAALEVADWPGNVRQLSNVVEGGLIRALGDGASAVRPEHLFPGTPVQSEDVTFQGATRAFQRRLLLETLNANGWNVSEAARKLDLARSYLNELLRAFELRRPGG